MALTAAEITQAVAGSRQKESATRERETGQRQLASALMSAIRENDAVALMNSLRELIKSVQTME